MSFTTASSLPPSTADGSRRSDDEREPAVVREQLAADDPVALHLVDERIVGAPSGRGSGNRGSGMPGPGWRAENIERAPRVPSRSCTSATSERSFSTDSRVSCQRERPQLFASALHLISIRDSKNRAYLTVF
jgi:hypothetical protein